MTTQIKHLDEVHAGRLAQSKPTKSQSTARSPGWIKSPELADAMAATEAQYRARIEPILKASKSELEMLTRRSFSRDLSFIANPQFDESGVGDEIFSVPLGLQSECEAGTAKPIRGTSAGDLPVHLGRMCEAALLTQNQESALFRRMNFLLHEASTQRSLLSKFAPSRSRLKLIERLILLAEWHRDRIVEANVRLVISIVKKFVNANNSFDDLLSEGIMGLMRAVEKFDYDRGFRFSTYATQVVRRNSYRAVVANQQERQKVSSGLQEMEVDISDEGRVSAISEKRWHDLQARLSEMLDGLDRREKLIIRARFSLGSHRRVHTLQSLADRLGISKERVRQLERRAMEKLRMMAGNAALPGMDMS